MPAFQDGKMNRRDSNKQGNMKMGEGRRGDGAKSDFGNKKQDRFQSPRNKNFAKGEKSDKKPNHSKGNNQQDPPIEELLKMEQMAEEMVPMAEKKFTGRCRLFVGNLTNDTTEDEFKKMFEPFGEFTEVYLNGTRGFGFIRMDTRVNAEAAKNALDGCQRKGRMLRVRFATHGAALKVKHISPHVTNELLAEAFSIFGDLERAIVIADDRGKSTGEGIVEFARKPGAQAAMKRINEGVFLLTSSPRPVAVEPLEQTDESDGVPEKFVQKNADFTKDREQMPRFVNRGTFEHDFAQKWKDIYAMHKEQEANLKRQFDEAVMKLEMEQVNAQMEHQTAMMRQDLMRRQEELRRMEESHQMEMQRRIEIRRGEEDRRRGDEDRRRSEMEMRQQEDMRHQELFAQQERALREMRGDRNAPPMQPPPAPPVGLGLERNRQGGGGGMQGRGEQGMGGGMNAQTMRQSRFDQPPNSYQGNNMGGGGGMMGGGGNHGNMGGGNHGNMGGGNMGGGGNHGNMGGGNHGNMNRGGPMGNDRGMMERRREGGGGGGGGRVGGGDEYFDNKRARRF